MSTKNSYISIRVLTKSFGYRTATVDSVVTPVVVGPVVVEAEKRKIKLIKRKRIPHYQLLLMT